MGWMARRQHGASCFACRRAPHYVPLYSTVRHVYPGPVPGYSDDWFAEHMLPEGAHNHSLDWTVMFLNRGKKALDEDWPRGAESRVSGCAGGTAIPALHENWEMERHVAEAGDEKGFLYCINLVRKQDDPTVRRGAVIKAMCICSRYNFIEVYRSLLIIALDDFYQNPSPTVLETLFHAINSTDISLAPRPTPWEKWLMRRGVADQHMGSTPTQHLASKWMHTLAFDYRHQKVRAAVPLYTLADETLTTSVSTLVSLFGQGVMTIYNAVLTGQRLIFVGYNQAAGDICNTVLAVCALVSPPAEGILHRTYPYASLSDLSFLETKSYIAGVTNPMFESHPEWWDVLCHLDISKGCGTILMADEKMAESGGRARAAGTPGDGSGGGNPSTNTLGDGQCDKERLKYPGDSAFVARLMAGIKSGQGESWVRCECANHTQELIDLALDQKTELTRDMIMPERLQKLLSENRGRLHRLEVVLNIREQNINPWARCRGIEGGAGAGGQGRRLRKHVRRLGLESNLTERHTREIFVDLNACLSTEPELQILLSMLPEAKGGISLLALGLLSTDATARTSARALLEKLEKFDSTAPAVHCMNEFFQLAYTRQDIPAEALPSGGGARGLEKARAERRAFKGGGGTGGEERYW